MMWILRETASLASVAVLMASMLLWTSGVFAAM